MRYTRRCDATLELHQVRVLALAQCELGAQIRLCNLVKLAQDRGVHCLLRSLARLRDHNSLANTAHDRDQLGTDAE